jgi:hypothetical protein
MQTLGKLRDDPRQVLYGSDYPVVTSVFWSWIKGWISRTEFERLGAVQNPLEKKFQLTKALGFPDRIFTDFWSLIKRDAKGQAGNFTSQSAREIFGLSDIQDSFHL